MSSPISPARDFSSANPTKDSIKALPLREPFPRFAHSAKREAQFLNWYVFLSEGKENKLRRWILRKHAGQRCMEACKPRQRPPPLTNWAMAHAAETGVTQLERLSVWVLSIARPREGETK